MKSCILVWKANKTILDVSIQAERFLEEIGDSIQSRQVVAAEMYPHEDGTGRDAEPESLLGQSQGSLVI